MGTTACCDNNRKERSEVDLSAGRRGGSEIKSRSVVYMHTHSLSKSSNNSSRRNLQIKLKEVGLDANGSSAQLEQAPALLKSRSGVIPGREIYQAHSSNENSNLAHLPSAPNHQTNYIVVVEADARNKKRGSDDSVLSKPPSYSRSIEKSVEEKFIAAQSNASNPGGYESVYKHSDGLMSHSVLGNKPENSIMQSKNNIEDMPSGRTIEQTLGGKTKDTLIVSGIDDLEDIDRFSDSKFLKSYIHLKEFSDTMVKKFINATSVLSSQYTEVLIVL